MSVSPPFRRTTDGNIHFPVSVYYPRGISFLKVELERIYGVYLGDFVGAQEWLDRSLVIYTWKEEK
jgi:hypothetical protein